MLSANWQPFCCVCNVLIPSSALIPRSECSHSLLCAIVSKLQPTWVDSSLSGSVLLYECTGWFAKCNSMTFFCLTITFVQTTSPRNPDMFFTLQIHYVLALFEKRGYPVDKPRTICCQLFLAYKPPDCAQYVLIFPQNCDILWTPNASFTPNSFAVRSPKCCGTGSNCVRTEWTLWQLFSLFTNLVDVLWTQWTGSNGKDIPERRHCSKSWGDHPIPKLDGATTCLKRDGRSTNGIAVLRTY